MCNPQSYCLSTVGVVISNPTPAVLAVWLLRASASVACYHYICVYRLQEVVIRQDRPCLGLYGRKPYSKELIWRGCLQHILLWQTDWFPTNTCNNLSKRISPVLINSQFSSSRLHIIYTADNLYNLKWWKCVPANENTGCLIKVFQWLMLIMKSRQQDDQYIYI